MSVPMEFMSLKNPTPSPLNRPPCSRPVTLCASTSLRFRMHLTLRRFRLPTLARTLVSPAGPGFGFCSASCQEVSPNRPVVAFAASHEESKHSEVEVEKEKLEPGADGDVSQEAWKQALASFKEQALKMQSVSQEAYRVNSQKAMFLLKETSEQLRIQAEKAKEELSTIAKEISEEGREYILKATEESPADVKEIVEAFSSADDLQDFSRVHDFHVGIPYGLLLFAGGFISFMVTGSIPAIRFGVILGGALLALSLASLKSLKKEESSTVFLKGQAAITALIFLREFRLLLSQRSTILGLLTTLVSGGVLAFYAYKIVDKKGGGPNLQHGAAN